MKVVIVGGGPAGLLAAHRLVQRDNYEVHVFDKRSDLRLENPANLRSYPIGLQERGLEAADPKLRAALEDAGQRITGVALQGGSTPRRMPREPSLYLDRNLIVYVMLNHITDSSQVQKGHNSSLQLHFERTIERLDIDKKVLYVSDSSSSGSRSGGTTASGSNQSISQQQRVSFDGLIAADGANSIIRRWLQAMGEIHVEEEDIPNHYRTFSIPLTNYDRSQTLDKDRVHGWMLGDKTCLMVPNKFGYASGVFIYPREDDPFEDMDVDDPSAVQDYFHQISPDSLAKFVGPDEALDMISRPFNYASTARVDRLHARDCVLFLGDSAHAVSASVGQACNAALQDVAKFDQVLDETNDHWHRSLLKFTERRLRDILALHELSDYSLPNPKDKWIQTEFIFRAISKKILPTFVTRHMSPMPNELLSTTNLSYSEILEQTEWWTEKVKRSMKATNSSSSLKRSPKSNDISLLDHSKRKLVRVR